MRRINPPVVYSTSVNFPSTIVAQIRSWCAAIPDRCITTVRLLLIILVVTASPAFGQTINIDNATDYTNAIQTINSNPNNDYTLNLINGFSLNQVVGAINTNTGLSIDGNSKTIDGASLYQPLVIDGGTIKLNNLSVTNPGSPVTVNGGTLIDQTGSLQGPIVNNSTVEFIFAAGTNYNYSGNMSGTGNVVVSESGAVTFSGVNSYTGGTTVVAGTTLIGTTSSITGPINDSWIVQFNQSTNGTYSGNITGTGGVEISNTGIITLTGTNDYTGSTLVDTGAIVIGDTNSLKGTIYNFGTVEFNQSTNGIFSGSISENGSVQIVGGATVAFTGTNTYTGGTVIGQGSTLAGTTTSLQGQFTDNGAVIFSQSVAGTFTGAINGTGSVEIAGGGAITLSGANSYTGGTIVDLQNTLIGDSTSLQGSITDNGLVKFSQAGNGTFAGNISGSGAVEISNTGPVEFTGTNSYQGGTTIDSGATLGGSTNSLQGPIINNGSLLFNVASSSAFSGNISGTGSVEIKDDVSATLLGNNNYSGGTTVDNGATLIGTANSIQGAVINNGNVQFVNTPNPSLQAILPPGTLEPIALGPGLIFWGQNDVYAGNISGTGGVTISGSGQLIFSGANNYTGGTTVNANNVLTGTTTSLQGNFTNNGSVQFIQTSAGDYAGNMTGSGSVEISGGPVQFSGANSYTGGTTVDANGSLIGSTTGVQGGINNYGSVQFIQSGIGTYAGNMTGAGSVVIGGGGMVTFTGTNSYQGGTTVNTGSTLIGTTNSLEGTINDNGLVKFDQSSNAIFLGQIAGTGAVEISGSGEVEFRRDNTFTGGTTIDNGSTLTVTGSVLGNVNVNSGGTLSGLGMVGNVTVNAGGTIFPNVTYVSTEGVVTPAVVTGSNTPPVWLDPLQITGNFIQGAGSKYSALLNPNGNNDELNVNGTAQIKNGTVLNLVLEPGNFNVGSKFDLISAAGGLSGTYNYVSTSAPTTQNIAFTEVYGPNNLQVIVNSNLANSALTSNQLSLASAIDRTSGTATGDYSTTITQLTTLGQGPLSNAMNQISGDIYPSISSIERQTTTAQMQLLSNRIASLSATGAAPGTTIARRGSNIRFVSSQGGAGQQPDDSAAAGKDPFGWNSWAQGYGLGGNIAGDGNAGGTNYRLGGTLFGTERWLTENTMIGVLGGYAGTNVGEHQTGASAQINSYQVGLYELHRQDLMYFSNIDAFSANQFNVSRPIDDGTVVRTASGNSNGSQWAHYTEGGATFEFDELRVQPFLGVQYMYLDQGGYSESGAGSLDLSTSHQIVNSVRNGVGARLYQEATWRNILFIPSVSARYQHEWGNGTQLISSSFSGTPTAQFTTTGNHTGRDFGLVTFSATAYVTERFSVYTMVDTQFASSFFALIGSGGIQYSW